MLNKHPQTPYIPFQHTHVFKCEVNANPLMAIIKGEYKNEEYFGYQVNFSDGFKATFISDEKGWKCEKEARLYLDAISKELNRFVAMQLTEFINSKLTVSH